METETTKRPYDHAYVTRNLVEELDDRGIKAGSLSSEEATRLIRKECTARNMHEPPTALEWSLAQAWCNALMMVDVAFGTCGDPKWQETPEGNYIDRAGGVVAEHFQYQPSPIQDGIEFLDMVGEQAGCDDCSIEVRDTEVRRKYEGNEPTREQCMLGVTLANAMKTQCPAPRPDELNPRNIQSPLNDGVKAPDAALAARVAAVVSTWQGRDRQTVADARLLLTAALRACTDQHAKYRDAPPAARQVTRLQSERCVRWGRDFN